MTVSAPDPVSEVITIVKIVVVVVMVGIVAYMGYRIKSLEAANAEQATEIVEYKNANDDWKSKTDAANAAIKTLQDEADAAQKAVAAAEKQAAVTQQSANDFARTIESKTAADFTVPVPLATIPADYADCTATKNMMNGYFGRKRP